MNDSRCCIVVSSPLVAAAILLAVAAPARAAPLPQAHFDQFIVRFKDSWAEKGNASLRQRLLDGAGKQQGMRVQQLRRLALGADVVQVDRRLDELESRDFVDRLRADPRVEYAEVDALMQPDFTPNDPYLASQWHYTDATAGIRLTQAWDAATGSGQVVAVIDTGATSHGDLSPNLVAGYDFLSDPVRSNDGTGRDNDPSDPGDWVIADECGTGSAAKNSSWHGTHVAGTIAAVTNNGAGVAGVAFGAKVQPLRALGKCGGPISDIADAIVWASGGSVPGVPANPTPAKVINLSLGAEGSCGVTYQNAIDSAVSRGSTIVVAAGNDAADVAGHRPANCNNVITVAALGRTGALASYSNYGAMVDIAAPGGDADQSVWSTHNSGTTSPGNQTYAGKNGTSMATPHVAGVAALVRSRSAAITPAQLESVLEENARAFPVACPGCGAGIVDAAAAVAAVAAPSLFVGDALQAAEGNTGTHPVTFTVSLDRPTSVPVTFTFYTADGLSYAGDDYIPVEFTGQTIPAGQTSKSFVVYVKGDTLFEFEEYVGVRVRDVTGAEVGDGVGYHSILDDDAGDLNRYGFLDQTGDAGAQLFYTFDVPAGATNVNIGMGGGAGDADLYVRFGAAPTLSTYDCRPRLPGNSESCQFPSPRIGRYYVMVYGYAAFSGIIMSAAYTPPVPAAKLTVADVSVVEGDSGSKAMTFVARLSEATDVPVHFSAQCCQSDSTASAGSDFETAYLSPTIPAGQTSTTISITIPGDTTPEPTEYLHLLIQSVEGADLGAPYYFATGYIINNDGPLLSINDVAVGEGNSGTKVMNFTVSLSQAAPGPVTYNLSTTAAGATAGVDYQSLNLTGQTIPAGQMSKTHSVVVNGDTTIEPTEVLLAYVRQPTGASVWDGQGTGYILNDDGPTLSIPDASVGEGNSGLKLMNVTVLLSQASSSPVTFAIASSNVSATAGSDYTALNLTNQTIPAGQTSKVFQIPIAGDTAIEQNESFLVTLAPSPVGATLYDRQAIATIYNDDGPTLSINDVSISEGNAGTKVATFTVTLSQAAAAAVTYNIATSNVTATAGSDYVAKSLVGETIPAGQTSKTFTVTLNGDTTVESNETFRATLSNISGNATLFKNIGTGTITNDD